LQAAYATTSTDVHPLLKEEDRVPITLDETVDIDIEEAAANEAETMFSMLSIEKDVRTSRMMPSHYSLWFLDGELVCRWLTR
jgi:hypothetical protein